MAVNFPSSPYIGQIYTYDGRSWEWNGTYWESYTFPSSGLTGATSVGVGDSVISGIVDNILELKSFSGDGITITDDGDTLTFSAATLPGTLVTSVSGGTGLSGNSTTGAIVLVNTAPDQTVTISGGTGITTGGTYPNFTLVNSLPDQTVTITGGTNIQIDGTYPNFGVNFTGTTGSNFTGGTVTGGTNFTGGLTANTFSATTYYNLPVSAITNGTGISASTSNGTVTITNTSPDQIVTISGGTGITTGGTYPNFTLVNSAPDQTVSITGGTNIQIAGTYPNFGVNFTGSTGTSGDYLPLSGGTVTGGTIFQSGVTANTVSQVNYIDFDTTPNVPSPTGGTLYFDSTENALSYKPITPNNDVTVNLGQESLIRIYNDLGFQINNGQALHITGATSGSPTVTLAVGTGGDSVQFQISGIATQDIPNSSFGFMTVFGTVRDLNLTGFTVGEQIYLSQTVPGGLSSYSGLSFTGRTCEVGHILDNSASGKLQVAILNEIEGTIITTQENNILAANNSSTGVFEFSGLSISVPSGTTFNVSPVDGWIIDNVTSPTNPTIQLIQYPGSTGNTAVYVSSATETYILLTSGLTITQQTTFPTPQQRRQNLYLGKFGHANKQFLINAFNEPDSSLSPVSQLRDMFTPIKLINEGVVASANGANLNINTSAGVLYGLGLGYITNKLNPNSLSVSGTSPCTFQYRTQTGGTASNTTLVIPGVYDNNGVVTAVGGGSNSSTNQRIYLVQNGQFRLQYGQQVYGNLAAAIEASQNETFTTFSNFRDNAILIGILSVNKNATNLSDTTRARFLLTSKFGETVGAAGGISTTNLQQAYNNSATPEIVTNSAEGALSIKNGTGNADGTTNLLEGINSGGTTTSFIRADGAFSGTSIYGTGLTASTISATTYQNLPQSVSGTGTQDYLTKWDPSLVGIVDSTIYDTGGFVGINTTSPSYGEAVSIQTANKGVLIDDVYVIQTGNGSLAFAGTYDYSSWGGYGEIAIGSRGPLSNSTGSGNIGIGDKALLQNITGNNNIGIGGTQTLGNNVGGNSNIGIGNESLLINSEGSYNISIGESSLRNNTSGSTNIAIGTSAGYSNLNDNGNVYIGDSAGYSNVGGNNIFIGYGAGSGDTSSSDRLNIGDTIFGSLSGKTIGINNLNPITTLDVSGTTRITGGLTASTVSATTYQNLPVTQTTYVFNMNSYAVPNGSLFYGVYLGGTPVNPTVVATQYGGTATDFFPGYPMPAGTASTLTIILRIAQVAPTSAMTLKLANTSTSTFGPVVTIASGSAAGTYTDNSATVGFTTNQRLTIVASNPFVAGATSGPQLTTGSFKYQLS
jgi:hypothetical protein